MRLSLTDFRGLSTTPGQDVRAPVSLLTATNAVLAAPGLLEKRKGYSRGAAFVGGPIWTLYGSKLLGSQLLAHSGTASAPATLSKGSPSTSWTAQTSVDSGSIAATAARRIQVTESGQRIYFTSAKGVRRLDSSTGSVEWAGMPRGLAPDTYNMAGAAGGAYDVLTGTGGFLADGSNCAYRVTWHTKDAAGVELGGPPTARLVVRNQSGSSGYGAAVARNVALRLPVPKHRGTYGTALTTSFFWRLWRSRSISSGIADDEMFLVAEAFLAAGDIAAGYASVTDTTTDGFLATSPSLHTNAVGFPPGEEGLAQGLLNSDDPPPQAECIAAWRGCTWYGNTSRNPAQQILLLAVGGSGLVADDTITINSTVYTAKAAPATATQFKIETGLASATMNIEATARNLVEVVNRNQADGLRLYYASLGTALPGAIFIEAAETNGTYAANGVTVSRAAAWRLGLDNGTGSSDAAGNRLHFSKQYRPDAVPVVNFFDLGRGETTEILKLIAFRDRLLVFTSDGIYQVQGSGFSDFTVTALDDTRRLLAREAVVVCGDRIYAWCEDGILEVDDGGAALVSPPIERDIRDAVVTATSAVVADYAFAVAEEKSLRVHFFYPASSTSKSCASWWTWDVRMRAWTQGDFVDSGAMEFSTGAIQSSTGLMVYGEKPSTTIDSYFFLERSAGTAADFQDTDRAGTTKATCTTMRFNFAAPDGPRGQAHWQQVALSFWLGASPRLLPTSLNLTWYIEGGVSAVSNVTPTAGAITLRVETPTEARRSNRLSFQVKHTLSEYVGLIGVSVDVGGASRWAR